MVPSELRARGLAAVRESNKLKELQQYIRERIALEEATVREAQAGGALGPITLTGDLESDAEARVAAIVGSTAGVVL